MKDESTVVKREESAASMRTGSTMSGSDNDEDQMTHIDNANETDKLL